MSLIPQFLRNSIARHAEKPAETKKLNFEDVTEMGRIYLATADLKIRPALTSDGEYMNVPNVSLDMIDVIASQEDGAWSLKISTFAQAQMTYKAGTGISSGALWSSNIKAYASPLLQLGFQMLKEDHGIVNIYCLEKDGLYPEELFSLVDQVDATMRNKLKAVDAQSTELGKGYPLDFTKGARLFAEQQQRFSIPDPALQPG